jgi:spore germination protein
MIRGIVITVLALGIAGTAFWGYREHQDKNAVLLNAENNYQRAFHDLSYQMDLLHDRLGATLAMNSRKSLSPALAEVWRISSQAHNDVGQLPLTLMPFNNTVEFLSKVGNFSYQTAIRDLDKEPLSNKEYNSLKSLYKQSGDIQNNLRNVQNKVLKNNLRWMDVETALASRKETANNTIVDGFKTVEQTVSGYDETDFGPTFTNMQQNEVDYNNLPGRIISKKDAVAVAKKYMGFTNKTKINVSENGKGSDYGFYSVTLKNPQTNAESSIDITKKGGFPIWFMNTRKINKQTISLNSASNHAAAFLKRAGFKGLDLSDSTQYDSIGVFNFVTKQNNVWIYPESIKVKVALDNGDIVGLSAEDYLQSHQANRVISTPKISMAQARTKLNPNLKVMQEQQAVILNKSNQDVLCYEFLGVIGEDTYQIFINADNGNEEEVQKLKNAEQVY